MVTTVQGSQCVMSNFYPCQITVSGKTFPSAEHYYQYRKAQHHSRTALSRRIIEAPSASQAKFLSKTIRANSTWQDQRPTFVRNLLRLKFDSCPEFRETLLSTTGYIDHTVQDTFWGSGSRAIPGINEFGLALASLRNQHQRPAKMTALVLGHSFIKHLDNKINNPHNSLQFSEPHDQAGKFSFFFHGVSGATLESLVAYVKRVRLLDHFLPTVVLLQVGGNDISNKTFEESRFQSILVDFTEYCQRLGCSVVVMGIWKRLKPRHCSVDVYDSRRATVHRLLNRLHVQRSLWFYPSRRVTATTQCLSGDGVHPSVGGYALLCKELSKALSWYMWRQSK